MSQQHTFDAVLDGPRSRGRGWYSDPGALRIASPNNLLQQTAALLSVSRGILPSRPPLLSFVFGGRTRAFPRGLLMTQSDSNPATEILRFAACSSRGQSSASFYSKAALSNNNLQQFLALSTNGPVSDGQVAQVACLIRDVSIKAFSYKLFNAATFWPALILFLIAALWPVVNYFCLSLENATVSGTLQTTLMTVAGILFAVYQQYKQKQGRIEDALRRTLFAHESIEDKIKRLIELVPSVDSGMSAPTLSTAVPRSKDRAEAGAADVTMKGEERQK